MADSTPLISEGRKKEGKQGHRKVRDSIFIMRIQIMITIIKSLCFGYSLTFICLICIAGSFVVAIVEK